VRFPVSGVECFPLWPPLAAFAVACLCAPAGVSGAVLLLPFQMSVLGFVSPAVTPTNLIYNIVATPGGVWRYVREQRFDWRLAWLIAAGCLPGVVAGAAIRVRYLPSPASIKPFVGLVLLYLAWRLLGRAPEVALAHRHSRIVPVSLAVGPVGGIYGIGGGAIVAPFLVSVCGIPAKSAAGPALLATFLTSVAGVGAFECLGAAAHPDWFLGLLLGAGGLFGTYCGARLQKHLPERWIRWGLAALVGGLAVSYLKGLVLD
jgi:uncharacterized membrane protein YfcA